MTEPTSPQAEPIRVENGGLIIPNRPIIPFIAGDGVGPEVMRSARQVVNAAVMVAYGSDRAIQWQEVLAGEKATQQTGNSLPEETLAAFKTCHVGLKGPLNTPVGQGARSLNVAMRKELDLYANFRPVRYYPPAPSPLLHPERVDVVLFRENTEDVYAGIEFEAGSEDASALLEYFKTHSPENFARIRFPQSSALGLKPVSREGSQRIIRSAIEYALANNRKTVTLLHKGNIMKFTEGGFMQWGYDLAEKEFKKHIYSMRQHKQTLKDKGEISAKAALQAARDEGKVLVKDMIVDAAFERAIAHPEDMDVLVTTNLNGDYLSDALAALVGGLGIAPGANINYQSGDAIFEAVHGTAPDIAGLDQANPTSLILSSMLMLRYIGWNEAANLIEKSLSETIAASYVTPDFACQMEKAHPCNTSHFTSLLIQRI